MKKHEIIIYKVDFDHISKTKEAFDNIRTADRSFNHPFGFNKFKMHGPFQVEGTDNFFVYASLYLTDDQYFRKCATSYAPEVRQACLKYIEHYCKENSRYFTQLCMQADAIKLFKLKGKK
jgi:hypothetical protein